jgi:hypothetical protein
MSTRSTGTLVTRTRVVRRKMIRVLTLQNIQNNKNLRFLAPILINSFVLSLFPLFFEIKFEINFNC